MFFWRKIFPYLQKYIPRNRNNKLLKILDKLAITYHSIYENLNYDCKNNGELFLLNKLNHSNNLNSIFDVGANIGSYSLLARKINKKCLIFAFEPVPETFVYLQENVSNKNIKTFNIALGSNVKAEKMLVSKDSKLSTLLLENSHLANKEDSHYVCVKVITGYEFLKTNNDLSEISLLKIDTEGYESEVLKGFKKIISRINVIQFEYGKANLFAKYFLKDYFNDYSSEYHIGKLYPNGVDFHEKYRWDLDDLIGPNFIMVKKSRSDLYDLLSIKS
tara:strand:+ start:205 stop:1029 length:825 start_codon:yes stop_codon:yes gene_type:complete